MLYFELRGDTKWWTRGGFAPPSRVAVQASRSSHLYPRPALIDYRLSSHAERSNRPNKIPSRRAVTPMTTLGASDAGCPAACLYPAFYSGPPARHAFRPCG